MMKKYDKEYSTQFMPEVDFLSNKGIKYSFVYRNDFDIRTYKYTKTKELFKNLVEFYD